MTGANVAKRDIRRRLRPVRREVFSDPAASAALVARLASLPEVLGARVVMSFEAVPGEPDLGPLADRLLSRGVEVVAPGVAADAPEPVEPAVPDVVLVPGVAFAVDGTRLGQGIGWYDRFLARVRPDCAVIGVCADEQVVADLPADHHDVPVAWIVTPSRIMATGAVSRPRSG